MVILIPDALGTSNLTLTFDLKTQLRAKSMAAGRIVKRGWSGFPIRRAI